MSKIPELARDREGRESSSYYKLERRVKELTSGYSTRELREFVLEELGEKIYRGGRPEYITKITLALDERFLDRGWFGAVKRNRLEEPTTLVHRAALSMHSSVGVRKTIEERVASLKAKYKVK